jgi:multiple sugar transport system ATP-binding protein
VLDVKNLTVKYLFGTYGIVDASFSCTSGEIIAIIGESGSGKTTIAKSIAGLIDDGISGSILLNNNDITKTNIKLRDIQLVFQEGGFYKNRSLKYNLLKILKMRKVNSDVANNKIDEVINIFGFQHLADCPVKKLNNVDRVLLKLARLLLREPKLMIIDDIFYNLSSEEKIVVYKKLHDLKNRFKFTCPLIFLTSTPNEALYVGSKIMVIRQGFVEQYAKKEDIINNPKTLYIDKLINKNRTFIALNEISCLINSSSLGNLEINDLPPGTICSYLLEETIVNNDGIEVGVNNVRFLDGYYLIDTDIGLLLTKKLKEKYRVKIIYDDMRFYDCNTEKRMI